MPAIVIAAIIIALVVIAYAMQAKAPPKPPPPPGFVQCWTCKGEGRIFDTARGVSAPCYQCNKTGYVRR